jgi:mannosyltransferase
VIDDLVGQRSAAPPAAGRAARRDLLLLAPPAVLALLGSVLLLQRPSLWYDELFTAHVGPLPLARLAQAVLSGEGTASYLREVPPSYNAPYYVVVHGWLAGTGQEPGELSLRSLSLLASVLAVAMLTIAVARLGGRATGVAAGLLVATNPLVLEYSVEARGYGLALLATAVAALGLARWLDGGRLLLYAAGAAAAGLAHWFALPVLAGLALATLVLRGRAAVPLLAATAAAGTPALALVALAATQDDGATTTGWITDTGGAVPWLSLQAWTAGSLLLLLATLVACGVAAAAARRDRPARRTAVVGACWVAVPLLLVTLAEGVRPVFVPRYLLPALLGLAVLAAVGTAGSRWRLPATGLLVALSLAAAAPLLDRPPREDARGAVAALARQHVAGQPVVAVDRRAALALEHYARGPVREDLRVPPADPPEADVVWLLRQASRSGELRPSDDDAVLATYGLRPTAEQVFRGSSSWLVLQRWSR